MDGKTHCLESSHHFEVFPLTPTGSDSEMIQGDKVKDAVPDKVPATVSEVLQKYFHALPPHYYHLSSFVNVGHVFADERLLKSNGHYCISKLH